MSLHRVISHQQPETSNQLTSQAPASSHQLITHPPDNLQAAGGSFQDVPWACSQIVVVMHDCTAPLSRQPSLPRKKPLQSSTHSRVIPKATSMKRNEMMSNYKLHFFENGGWIEQCMLTDSWTRGMAFPVFETIQLFKNYLKYWF